MKRREFITLFTGAAIAGPRVAVAQPSSKIYRVGTLLPGAPIDEKSPLALVLLQGLEKHGYVRGKNLEFESHGAGGQMSKLGELVRDMKTNHVDVIVGGGFPSALACKVANVPTVIFLGAGDPVATHLIDSLSHPGGNITGISDNATALASKRLALIKQAVPKVNKVAMLWNRDDLGMSMRYEASATAARSLGTTVQALGVREPDDFRGVFEAMDRDPPDAIFMVADGLTTLNRKRVIDYAAMHHIPAMFNVVWAGREGMHGQRCGTCSSHSLTARGPPISRSRSRHATSSSSTSRPRRQPTSPCRRIFSLSQTR